MKLKIVIVVLILKSVGSITFAQSDHDCKRNLMFSQLCGTWIWVKSTGICSYQSKDEEIIGFNYLIEISKDSIFKTYRNNTKINEGRLKISYPIYIIQTEFEKRIISLVNQDTLYLGDGICKKSIYVRKKG